MKMTITHKKIDWGRLKGFVNEKNQEVQGYLEERLKSLNLIKPVCTTDIYFSAVSLRFYLKGMVNPSFAVGLDLAFDQENELIKNLDSIANVVQEAAEKINFRVVSGYRGFFGKRFFKKSSGCYKFIPNYQDFALK